MSWDELKKVKEQSAGSIFVKLKDGDSIEGIFRGEPRFFYQTFGERTEHNTWAEGRNFRFRVNMFTKDDEGIYAAKIFQGGAKVRDAILDARDEYGLDCMFKIKRTGSTKEDTRYAILFKSQLTPEELTKIKSTQLRSLVNPTSEKCDSSEEKDVDCSTEDGKDEGPFSD
jgi:hypothetical protein